MMRAVLPPLVNLLRGSMWRSSALRIFVILVSAATTTACFALSLLALELAPRRGKSCVLRLLVITGALVTMMPAQVFALSGKYTFRSDPLQVVIDSPLPSGDWEGATLNATLQTSRWLVDETVDLIEDPSIGELLVWGIDFPSMRINPTHPGEGLLTQALLTANALGRIVAWEIRGIRDFGFAGEIVAPAGAGSERYEVVLSSSTVTYSLEASRCLEADAGGSTCLSSSSDFLTADDGVFSNVVPALPLPEPTTALLLACGLVGLAVRRRP